jgi:hypothetical protein
MQERGQSPAVQFRPRQGFIWKTLIEHQIYPKELVACKLKWILTQCVQVLLGLCSLKIQDVNYFQNFTLFIQNGLLHNQYIAGIDFKVFENSHYTPFVESHLKLR